MQQKLAVKTLTYADLTFFEWHFRLVDGNKQKAIRLNADVFVDRLYPFLPIVAKRTNGKFPVELSVYGPGAAGEYNLQRRFTKFSGHKDWALGEELIF